MIRPNDVCVVFSVAHVWAHLRKPGTYSQRKLWATRASNRASDVDSYGRPLPSVDKTTPIDPRKFPIVGEKQFRKCLRVRYKLKIIPIPLHFATMFTLTRVSN